MTAALFDVHAVHRIVQRKLPINAIAQIAETGVPVQETDSSVLVRGQCKGQPIHVFILKQPQGNVIHTAYVADEWESKMVVSRPRKRAE